MNNKMSEGTIAYYINNIIAETEAEINSSKEYTDKAKTETEKLNYIRYIVGMQFVIDKLKELTFKDRFPYAPMHDIYNGDKKYYEISWNYYNPRIVECESCDTEQDAIDTLIDIIEKECHEKDIPIEAFFIPYDRIKDELNDDYDYNKVNSDMYIQGGNAGLYLDTNGLLQIKEVTADEARIINYNIKNAYPF